MNLRRIAAALAVAGLAIGLIGAGVAAQYTDTASAYLNAHVGTLTCLVSSSDPNAVVSPDGHSLTITMPDILSSASTAYFVQDVTLTNTGSIAEAITWTFATGGTLPADHWMPTGLLGYYTGTGNVGNPGNMQTPFQLAPGAHQTYTGVGFAVADPGTGGLDNSYLDKTASVTMTAHCGEVPSTTGIQFIAGASANASSVAIPSACQPGDLALAVAVGGNYQHLNAIDNGFTNWTQYGYVSAAIRNQFAYKTLLAGDTTVSTPTGSYPASAIEVVCYRHAAMAMNAGALFVGEGNVASSTNAPCMMPAGQFGYPVFPTDGSAAVVCLDGTTNTATNIKSMFSPPVAPATGGLVANRSAGFGGSAMGAADTVNSVISTWPALGSTLANWTQSPASNHATVSVGIVYKP